MKANVNLIKKNRHYTTKYKKDLVSEFEKGQYSVLQLSRLHGVPFQTIYNWIYKYSTFNEKGYRVVEKKESSSKKLKDLSKQVKDLEAMLGRKQIMIDYLEKMIALAGEELSIDIKKNYSPRFCSGSDKTDQI